MKEGTVIKSDKYFNIGDLIAPKKDLMIMMKVKGNPVKGFYYCNLIDPRDSLNPLFDLLKRSEFIKIGAQA